MTEAANGHSEAERGTSSRNFNGALIRLVYLASLLSTAGTTLYGLVEGKSPVPVSKTIVAENLDPPPPEFAGQILCSDLEDKEEQVRYGNMMDVFSSREFFSRVRCCSAAVR
ncbi:hypothetical protein GQ53DRAFT_815285 [Thozetella sp. PMI_491]|nr:hypothetical protein GQ53DRAFT_815285 [Thozetella sp. PMI_491]